jgi:autotransporter-associated beta strand protein
MTFNAVTPPYYNFKSGSLRLGAGNANGISTVTVNSGATADFGANAGSGITLINGGSGSGLTCTGGGTVMLSGTAQNTYTGPTTIQGSTTVYIGAMLLGASSATVNLTSGTLATHNSTARAVANPVSLKGDFTIGAPSPRNGTLTFGTGAWTISGASRTITVDTISAAINSAIGGSGLGLGFSSLNSGKLTLGLSGTEGYTGPTTINSGTLALGVSCNLNAASGVVIAAGGTFDVSAQTTWTAGSSASPAITASGTATPATIKGGTTVAFGSTPITLNYDGTDDTMLTISQGALTMSGNTVTINTNTAAPTSPLGLGAHNVIHVTGGSLTASGIVINGTAIPAGDIAIASVSGGDLVVTISVAAAVPILDTTTKSAITNTTATLGASVNSNNGSPVTEYGIVWGAIPNPTTADNKVIIGTTDWSGAFTAPVTGLPAGTNVNYRGYAINANGTGYSTNDTFVTLTNEPTVQASGVSFSSVQGGAMTVSWTRGNGGTCIVLAKAGSAVDANPVDSVTYTDNSNFGSGTQIGTGNYVIYKGTGNTVNLTALTPGITYNVAVFEYNGFGVPGSQNYLTTSPATGSQATTSSSTHPVVYYSSASASDPTSLSSWWTGNNGTGANPANFTSGDTFIIQNGHTYTVASGVTWTNNAATGGTAATLQINSGGHLAYDLSSTTVTVRLGGNLVQSAAGGLTASTSSGSGVLEFTSSGTWTGSGDISAIKLVVFVDAGATLDASGMSSGFKLKTANTVGFDNLNGTINLGAFGVNGNGNSSAKFVLGTSGTLITAIPTGVPSIFTNIFTGKVTLPTTANYTFNGSLAQVTGTSTTNATMPSTVNNLTINNAAGVTLSQATTIYSTLNILGGTLTPSGTSDTAGALTFDGSTYQATGTWGSSSSSPAATHQDDTRFAGTGLVTVNGPVAAASATQFRSRVSGNWNVSSTWEASLDGTTWSSVITGFTSGSTPGSSQTVTVRTPNTVTLAQNEACGTLNVNGGGTLDFNSHALTVASASSFNGTLKMEVTKTGPSTFTGSKLTQSAGTLSYNGTLTVTTNVGVPLAGGDVIDLFDASAFGGSFTTTNYPAYTFQPGESWSAANLTVDGSIMIAVAPSGPTGPGYITNSISSSTLTMTWPAGQSWRLVGQTNSLSTGLNTNSAAWGTVTGGIDGSNSITINPAQPTVFYRLVYP